MCRSLVLLLFLVTYSVQDFITTKDLQKKMKAIGYYKNLPISDMESLLDLEVDVPKVLDSDVLIEVKAIGVNPIDYKLRTRLPTTENSAKILGLDGAGVVVAKGVKVNRFDVGDEVFFLADFRRNGSYAQYVAVNEITVGPKPEKLTFEQAAAMPLTAMTAYESIYDRLLITEKDEGKTLLIINSAGGVGSVATQMAKNLRLKVIGTASRPETQAFSREHGADIVINHKQDLKTQLEGYGYTKGIDFILINFDPYPYWDTLMKIIKPQGKICLIVPSSGSIDTKRMLEKSVTLVAEMLTTRFFYDTEDKYRQQEILEEISKMLDDGKLNSTLTRTLTPINAANLREAHRLLEEHGLMGKLVLSGFDQTSFINFEKIWEVI